MSSDRTARAGLVALGITNVVLLALLFSRSSAPSVGALGRAGLEQDFEAGHNRKLLASLVGEELASDPEQFRRRLQQTFKYSHCFSEYSVNRDYLVMDCPFFVKPTISASTGQPYNFNTGAYFAVLDKSGNDAYASVDFAGTTRAKTVFAETLNATNLGVSTSLTVQGSTQLGDVNAANLAISTSLSARGNTQLGDVNAVNLAVSTSLFAQGSTQLGDVNAANLAVSTSLSAQGSTQLGDVNAANLAVSTSLTAQGSTQLGDVNAANLAVSKALSVQGKTQFGDLAVTNLAVVDSKGVPQVSLNNKGLVQAATFTATTGGFVANGGGFAAKRQGQAVFTVNPWGSLTAEDLNAAAADINRMAVKQVVSELLSVSKALLVPGRAEFSGNGAVAVTNLAAANLNVTSLLRSTGKTQLSDLSVPALTVSGAASFGGDVTAAKSVNVRGKLTAPDALLDNAEVKGEIKTRTMIASSNVAVRGDFWVSKDFTTNGQVIVRAGLVAKTCTCSGRRY